MIHTDSMNVKSKKAEQSEVTRSALIGAAKELFTEHGYAETATEQIVQRAGVTRGALYHHFRNKEDLFLAVFEVVEQEFGEAVAAASMSQGGGQWERLSAGFQGFLDGCLEPAVQRIVLLDALSVLGWETYRSVEDKYGLAMMQHGLQVAMDAGVLDPQPAAPLAHLLLSALHEAGMVIARADDVQAARAEMGAAVDRLLKGLRA